MMITYVGLISRAKMEDFNLRCGGITWPALEEFIQPDSLQAGDMIRRLPKARGLDSDSRYNRRALVAMSLALGIAAKEGLVTSAPALIRAISFYWPLVPQDVVFDDSGGRERAVVTVLSPQRCSHLLNCWQSVDVGEFERAFADPSIFEQAGPAYVFESGAHLVEYLRFYEAQLGQVVAEDRFYLTFYG